MADPEKFKEKFVDPNTGETVTRVEIKPEFLAEIDKNVNANAAGANAFLQISRQIVALQIQQRIHFDAATKSEQDIGKEVLRIREKMGLDSSWVYNIQMKVMEKRESPPETKILTDGLSKEPAKA